MPIEVLIQKIREANDNKFKGNIKINFDGNGNLRAIIEGNIKNLIVVK